MHRFRFGISVFIFVFCYCIFSALNYSGCFFAWAETPSNGIYATKILEGGEGTEEQFFLILKEGESHKLLLYTDGSEYAKLPIRKLKKAGDLLSFQTDRIMKTFPNSDFRMKMKYDFSGKIISSRRIIGKLHLEGAEWSYENLEFVKQSKSSKHASTKGDTNRFIRVVKNSTLNYYPSTTIGKAFDASFDETQWLYYENRKGEKIVEFNGKISQDLHDSAIKVFVNNEGAIEDVIHIAIARLGDTKVNAIAKKHNSRSKARAAVVEAWLKIEGSNFLWPPGTPVKVLWAFSSDETSFFIKSFESDAWSELHLKDVLDTIYY